MLSFLRHPLTRDLDLDDPQTTQLRKRIIKEKRFLNRIYQDWYEWIASELPSGEGPVLELGSGAGFLDEHIPGLITSEVFYCPMVKVILDGCSLPFMTDSLRSIVMVDVFHHIPDARSFLSEAQRCLRPGGRILMVEPWVTPWSRFVYSRIHHEPFVPDAHEWEFPVTGPLSGANSALPWIVLERDRKMFEWEFPGLRIKEINVGMPFRYLASGGVSLRSLMPGFSYSFWKYSENAISQWNNHMGMFAEILLSKA